MVRQNLNMQIGAIPMIRAYLHVEEALAVLKDNAGTQFDQAIVQAHF